MDEALELLEVFACMTPAHREQGLWLARELNTWETRYPLR